MVKVNQILVKHLNNLGFICATNRLSFCTGPLFNLPVVIFILEKAIFNQAKYILLWDRLAEACEAKITQPSECYKAD